MTNVVKVSLDGGEYVYTHDMHVRTFIVAILTVYTSFKECAGCSWQETFMLSCLVQQCPLEIDRFRHFRVNRNLRVCQEEGVGCRQHGSSGKGLEMPLVGAGSSKNWGLTTFPDESTY